MTEEYTDDQIGEWTVEDLLNSPLLSTEEIEELRKSKRELTIYAKQKFRELEAQKQTQNPPNTL